MKKIIFIVACVLGTFHLAAATASAYTYCGYEDDCYLYDDYATPTYYYDNSSTTSDTQVSYEGYCDEYDSGYDCVHYIYTDRTNTQYVYPDTTTTQNVNLTFPSTTYSTATYYPVYYPVQTPVYVPVATQVQSAQKNYVTVYSKPTKQNGFVVRRTYSY